MLQDKDFGQIKILQGALSSRFPWFGDSGVLVWWKAMCWKKEDCSMRKLCQSAVILAEMDGGFFVKEVSKMLYNH